MEAADGQPSRAMLVLERAESEGCCLHERIWLMHSDLLLGGLSAKGPVSKRRTSRGKTDLLENLCDDVYRCRTLVYFYGKYLTLFLRIS